MIPRYMSREERMEALYEALEETPDEELPSIEASWDEQPGRLATQALAAVRAEIIKRKQEAALREEQDAIDSED